MKCFYHASDLDGKCSGAIIKYFNKKAELIPINYGDGFPWDKISINEKVFLVDFCLQPFSDMEQLNKLCELHWIDHHKSSLDHINDYKFCASGSQLVTDGLGACYLSWISESKEPVPYAVQLLAHYDVWDLLWSKDKDIGTALEFHSGILTEDTSSLNQEFWSILFRRDALGEIKRISANGKIILKYMENEYADYIKNCAIETEFEGYKAIVINRGLVSSLIFNSIPEDKYPLKITFSMIPSKKWTISLYSSTIDVSKIANKYGGGGHKQAAGFQCKELPFNL